MTSDFCTIIFLQDKGMIGNKKATRDASDGSKDYSLLVYSSLLKNEILGTSIEDFKEAAAYANSSGLGVGSSNGNGNSDNSNIPGNVAAGTGVVNADRRGGAGVSGLPNSFPSPGGSICGPGCSGNNR